MKKIIKIFSVIPIVLFLTLCIYITSNRSTPILMYHSIDKDKTGNFFVSPLVFYKQMKFIKDKGFTVIGFSDYCRLITTGKKPPRKSLVITFDDGYKNNFQAIKILTEFNFPATIFVIPANLNNYECFSHQDIIDLLKTTPVKIGSHSLTHAYLPEATDIQLEKEIKNSKIVLENFFPAEINIFSYPKGGFNDKILKTVEEAGYLCACTTNRGFSKKLNRFALRRIKITNHDLDLKLWIKLSGFYNVFRKPKKPY